jgi:hypothetical protein
MKKVIKGVGVLDLTTATKESLNGVNEIKGVGCLLLSENNPGLLEGVELTGIGTTIKVPEFDKNSLIMKVGITNLDQSFFKSATKPMILMLTGITALSHDVTEEVVKENVSAIYGAGIIACPEHVVGTTTYLSSGFTGEIVSYKGDMKMYIEGIKIDNQFLESLDDGTAILVIGNIDMLSDIDVELFNIKINNMKYIGDVIAYERYRSLLSGFTGKGNIDYIPDGLIYCDDKVELSSTTCDMTDGESWYISGTLYIKEDVTEEMLKNSLKAVHCSKLICPRILLSTIKPILINRPKVLSYTNKIRTYTDNIITAEQLEYEKLSINIQVNGKLTFDESVTLELLEQKVEAIDNYGAIICDTKLYPAVMDKVRENTGTVSSKLETGEGPNEEPKEIAIVKGTGYLKL